MSRERLEWTLALLDRASGPARKVARGLDAVSAAQDRVKKAGASGGGAGRDPLDILSRASAQRHTRNQARLGRELEKFAQQQGRVTGSTRDWGAIGATAFMAVGAAALAAAAAVGRITIALGESMVQAADWRNRTEGAFRVLLGAQDRPALVGQAFQRASQYANRFGLDVRDVARQMIQLTAAGFSQSEIPRVMQAAGDLGALEGPQAAERAITALRQIRAKGLLQLEELSGQLADTGLNVGDVINELATRRGTSAASVRAAITARRVNADEGISAVMGVIARRSGGRLGGTLDTQSRGAEAAMNRLKNAWLLLQSNFARSPAFARIIAFIERMATALDPASASAQRFSAQLDRFFGVLTGAASQVDPVAVFNGVVGALGSIGSAIARIAPMVSAFYQGFFAPLRATLGALVPQIRSFFGTIFNTGGPSLETLRGIGTVFGVIASVGAAAIGGLVAGFGLLARVIMVPLDAVTGFWRAFVGAFSGVELTFSGIGTAIVRGLWAGIQAAWGRLREQWRGFVAMLPTDVKNALGIHSPSRVFAQLGGHVADGFALGIEGGTAGVRSAIGSMVDVGAVGARAARGARGGSLLALTINVQAPEGADADEWGAVIASHVAREIGGRTERAA
jgi:hypothetical protein